MSWAIILQDDIERRMLARGRRIFKDRGNPLEWAPEDFQKKYRLPRHLFFQLSQELDEDLRYKTHRNHSLSSELQLLCTLRFLATGSFQSVVGCDEYHRVDQATVSRAIDRVLAAINKHCKKYISFPQERNAVLTVKQNFADKYRFPNVIGAIDCTHVRIQKPFREDPRSFMNRKQYYSVNMQVVCDAKLRILDVVAEFPGSVHDSHIWRMSGLRGFLQTCSLPQPSYLIGDSGYPLEPWLLTPVSEPQNLAEENYNFHFKEARKCIERCFGILKCRFRCIDQSGGTLLYQPGKVCNIFMAVCVLHNFLLQNGCPEEPVDSPQDNSEHEDNVDDDDPTVPLGDNSVTAR
ncbi:hypothetical protein lerEdw1_015691, partial [Lerista edwardsae]